MIAHGTLVGVAVVVGVVTYAFRAAGPWLGARLRIPERVEQLMSDAAVVLLLALVATATFFDGHAFAGPSRVIGVGVGAVLAWRRAPFVLVVVAAAATAAVLRLLGMP